MIVVAKIHWETQSIVDTLFDIFRHLKKNFAWLVLAQDKVFQTWLLPVKKNVDSIII